MKEEQAKLIHIHNTLLLDFRQRAKKATDWKALTDKSRADYEQKYSALNEKTPIEKAKCKQSYYSLRAAYLQVIPQKIRKGLNEIDALKRQIHNLKEDEHAANVVFIELMDKLYASSLLMAQWQTVQDAPPYQGPRKGVEQSTHSKRALGKLPQNWKTKLVGGVPKKSEYRAHVAAMALCGCRPSEFENSVVVKQIDADTFEFTICGKKSGTRVKNGKTFTTGQTLRTVTVTRNSMLDKHGQVNPEFIVLERALAGKKYAELTAKATAIRDVVIRASKKAFPDMVNRPTAYSFRHAFASNLKAANGEDSEETAAALGHSSTKTQQGYGYSKHGRSSGGGYACKASATDRIRTPHKTRKLALSKTSKIEKVAMPAPNSAKVLMPSVPPSFVISRAPKPSNFSI